MKNKTWRRGFVFVAASASRPSFHCHWRTFHSAEVLYFIVFENFAQLIILLLLPLFHFYFSRVSGSFCPKIYW